MKKLLLALALSLAAAGAQAVPLSTLLGGGTITAGDKLFDQWALTYELTSGQVNAANTALIDVTSLADGGDDPGPGININFADQMTVGGDGTYAFHDLTLAFRVSTLGSKKIKDNSLTFGNPPSGLTWVLDNSNDLGMYVRETVKDALGNELADKSIEFSILDDVETRDFPDSAQFAYQDEIFVVKNFLVWAVDATDTAALAGVEQRFSQAPEPASIALITLALAGLVASRRRKQ